MRVFSIRSLEQVVVFVALLMGSMWLLGCERSSPNPQATRGSTSTSQAPKDTKPVSAMVVAGPKNIAMLPLIASARSLLPEGVTFKPVQTGKLAMDGVIAGDITVGVIVDTNIAHVAFRPDVDLVVIAAIMEKTDDALVVRSDLIKKPADLVGKTISYVPATTSDSFLWRFLESHNIKLDQVKLVGSMPPAIPPAMASGEIAAASVWEPWRFNIRTQLKDNAGEFTNNGIYTAYALFAVRRSTLAERREELRSLLNSMIAAEVWIEANRDEAQKILAAEIPIDAEALKASWSFYSPRVRISALLVPSLVKDGEHLRATQDAFKDKPLPDYAKFVDSQLLREVSSERVEGP